MNRMTNLLTAVLLLALLLLGSCLDQTGTNADSISAAIAADDHDGHDHASHADDEEADVHTGHDHAAGEEEGSHAGHDDDGEEVDPHAGHDHNAVEEEDSYAGHDHGDEDAAAGEAAGTISLELEQIRELGIMSTPAGPGSLGRDLELTGEITINEDLVTHVSPRIGGIIRHVYGKLGDHVRAGAPLLELDSIELAEAASDYLALLSRIGLLQDTLQREEMLLEKGISAEQDYLEAKQAHDEALIARRTMEQKLSALGLSGNQISNLTDNPDASLTAYTVVSPVGGEIIEKHASLGEIVGSDTEVFTIGDLRSVWVRLNVYQQDFLDVSEGMAVLIDAGHGIEPVSGTIDYIEPLIGEETRTAIARVVLSQSSHVFRPGLFVTGYLEVGGGTVDLVVPRNAVVDLDQDKLVFVRTGTSFEPRMVSIGRQTAVSTEVLSGLEPGEEIVVAGAFQLKAELLKGTFDPHAGHAH